jgi:hypothetical protein
LVGFEGFEGFEGFAGLGSVSVINPERTSGAMEGMEAKKQLTHVRA